jgi:L-alanine-DL-glutamate epimerase-like enolase superfamily enzyme
MERIEQIDVLPVSYPLKRHFKFFPAARSERAQRPTLVVKVTADNGVIGWGQSVPVPAWSYECPEAALAVLRDYYAPALLGRDPSDIAGAMDAMDLAIAPGFSTGMPISRAGIDIALHDLAAKLQGQSLAEMWGRQDADRVKLSWTVNVQTLDEVQPAVAEGLETGYSEFNIKIGSGADFDLELVQLVRELAPDTLLWTDANCGYGVKEALDMAPRLADAGVDLLESPLPPNRIQGYQALKKQGAVPIFMDEGVVSPVELEEFIKLEMLDGVAMKPARCGGLWSCRRQIELLEQRGLRWVGSGLCDPDISLAASLALFAAYGVDAAAALNGPQFLTGSVLTSPIAVNQGVASVPDGPGLGVEINEEKLK